MLRQRAREAWNGYGHEIVMVGVVATALPLAFAIEWVMPTIEPLASSRGVAPLIPMMAYLFVSLVAAQIIWTPALTRVPGDRSKHTQR